MVLDQRQDPLTIPIGNVYALFVFGWTRHQLAVVIRVIGVEAEVGTGGFVGISFGQSLFEYVYG